MTPQRFAQANTVMRRPPGWTEEQCCDVHSYVGPAPGFDHVVITAWRPSPEELVRAIEAVNRSADELQQLIEASY